MTTENPKNAFNLVKGISPPGALSWSSLEIEPGAKFRCVATAIYHPSNFYLIFKDNLKKFEKKLKELNTFYSNVIPHSATEFKPGPQEIRPKMCVAVLHGDKWHRGVIKQVDRQSGGVRTTKVFLMDTGEHVDVPLPSIRYIPLEFLTKLPAQAIKCKLHLNGNLAEFHEEQLYWTKKEAEFFASKIKGQDLFVEFVKTDVDANSVVPTVWHVIVSKETTTANGTVTSSHVPLNKSLFRLLQAEYDKEVFAKTGGGRLALPCNSDKKEEEENVEVTKSLEFPGRKELDKEQYFDEDEFAVHFLDNETSINESVLTFQGKIIRHSECKE